MIINITQLLPGDLFEPNVDDPAWMGMCLWNHESEMITVREIGNMVVSTQDDGYAVVGTIYSGRWCTKEHVRILSSINPDNT